MAANTTLRSGTSRDTAVFSTGVIPIDGDKVTVSKLGTATSRTLSAGISAAATSIPVSAGTGTVIVGEMIEFDSRPGEYYEVTGPGAIGATALGTGAASITVSPGVAGALASGSVLRNRGHKVVLLCANRLTDAAGYAIGATSITLQAGALAVLTGNMIRFGANATFYKVSAGVGTGSGAVTITPGLVVAIPASATTAIESTVWGDDTSSGVTVNGVLYWDRASHSSLVCKGTYTVSATGTEDRGTAIDPLTAYNAQMFLNYSAAMALGKYGATYAAGGRCLHYGKTRTRRTTLDGAASAGATSFTVVDATGWDDGDELLVFPTALGSAVSVLEKVSIAAGGVSGNTITITAGLTNSKLTGAHVSNLTSNVLTTEQNRSFGASTGYTMGASGRAFDKNIINSCFWFNGNSGANAGSGFKSNYGCSGSSGENNQCYWNGTVLRFDVYSDGDSVVGLGGYPRAVTFENGVMFVETGANAVAPSTSGVAAPGGIKNSTIASKAGSAIKSGLTAGPSVTVPLSSCLLYSGAAGSVVAAVNSMAGGVDDCIFMSGISKSTVALSATFPGLIFNRNDFAPFGMSGAAPFLGVPVGNCTISNATFPASPPPSITYGAAPGGRIQSLFGTYYGVSTGQHEIWDNNGYAHNDTATKLNSDAALQVVNRTTSPFVYSFAAAIPNGATRRILCNVRRNSTYAAGSMPSVTLSIPGVTSVSSAVTDSADTWHKADLSITNTTGSTQEVTVTLSCNGAANASSAAWFDGIPIYPFVQAVRHYGFEFDEANPFRVVDPTLTSSEATAAAITGVSVNHATDTITVTAARTAAEVYAYCAYNWAVSQSTTAGQTPHITGSEPLNTFTTTYTVVLSGAGAISGKYTDSTGTVVSAAVTGIVPGSRILIVRTDTSAVLSNAIVAGTSHSVSVTAASAIPISVTVRKASAAPFYQEWVTTGSIDPSAGFSAVANQQPD